MRQIKYLFAGLALLTVSMAGAQVTPQAVIGNVPSLPTPQQWAANGGHTEEFTAKIAELHGKLNEIQAAAVPNVTQADLQQAQANQQRRQQQQQRQQQQDINAAKNEMAA
ncbi:MAG: hypothetical protein LBH82_07165, partial [Bacteroidales bacterium]|nr:hypothetical protein [Bacteroidales bacterium]